MSVRILDQHLHVARGKKVSHIDKNASVKKILTFILPLEVRRSYYLRALSHGKKFSVEIRTGTKAVTGLFEDSVCYASILYILPKKKGARPKASLKITINVWKTKQFHIILMHITVKDTSNSFCRLARWLSSQNMKFLCDT